MPAPETPADFLRVARGVVVFMHLEAWDRHNYILEAKRVLRPGGRFYCDNVHPASERGWAVGGARPFPG